MMAIGTYPPEVMQAAREAIAARVSAHAKHHYLRGQHDDFAVVQACCAAIMAERERMTAHLKAMCRDGCALFLDGRNEHGSHVLPLFPNSMPDDAFGEEDGVPSMAEEIISAAEAAGFEVGQCVWANFRWNAPQTGDEGRVELAGYWQFSHINADLTRLLWGHQKTDPAASPTIIANPAN